MAIALEDWRAPRLDDSEGPRLDLRSVVGAAEGLCLVALFLGGVCRQVCANAAHGQSCNNIWSSCSPPVTKGLNGDLHSCEWGCMERM